MWIAIRYAIKMNRRFHFGYSFHGMCVYFTRPQILFLYKFNECTVRGGVRTNILIFFLTCEWKIYLFSEMPLTCVVGKQKRNRRLQGWRESAVHLIDTFNGNYMEKNMASIATLWINSLCSVYKCTYLMGLYRDWMKLKFKRLSVISLIITNINFI